VFVPCLLRTPREGGGQQIRIGHRLLDAYLDLVQARARPNTLLAVAYDLKVFFSAIVKDPVEVTAADVLEFIKAQREPRHGDVVVRLEDGEAGLAARTIKRRLATLAGLYEYLIVRGDVGVTANPVPRGLAMRRPGQRAVRGLPLIRTPRTLPRVLTPGEIDAFLAGLRTSRDRAMVEAMLLGGLRRCEVLALRLGDLQVAARRVFIAEGKGGHQRIVPISPRFFATLAVYFEHERPENVDTDCVRGSQGPQAGSAAIGGGAGRDRAWCAQACGNRTAELPSAASHLPDQAA
jgi:integrase/recombinase XerD